MKTGWRLVRVDHKTQIEVGPDISDEDAIVRFQERQAYVRDPQHKRIAKIKKGKQ